MTNVFLLLCSPVLMCAALIFEGLADDPGHAEQLVKSKRPGIHINLPQFKALSSWYRLHLDRTAKSRIAEADTTPS